MMIFKRIYPLGTAFASNTIITRFNELALFTGLVAVSTQHQNWTAGGFAGCSNLEEVTLPPALKTLGCYSFRGTSNLEYIHNLENIEYLHYSTYSGIYVFSPSGIKEINLPNLKENIPANTLRGCNRVEKVVIGAGCRDIGTYNFYGGLYSVVIFLATEPPTLAANNTSMKAIYVPDESLDAYKTASVWSAQASKIHPISEYTES